MVVEFILIGLYVFNDCDMWFIEWDVVNGYFCFDYIF